VIARKVFPPLTARIHTGCLLKNYGILSDKEARPKQVSVAMAFWLRLSRPVSLYTIPSLLTQPK
jgi:hypothetical protein